MKKSVFWVCLLLILNAANLRACPEANSEKLFPIGSFEGKVISLFADVHRNGTYVKNYRNRSRREFTWNIATSIRIHDRNGKLLEENPFLEKFIVGYEDKRRYRDHSHHLIYEYDSILQICYDKAIEHVKERYPAINMFEVQNFTFCDWQLDCSLLSLKHDTLSSPLPYFVFEDKKYPLTMLVDSLQFPNSPLNLFPQLSKGYRLNSIRVFANSDIRLVAAYLMRGDGVEYGEYVSEKDAATFQGDSLGSHFCKEYAPAFDFKAPDKRVYKEPVYSHQYGFDVLFAVEP